MHQFMTTKQFNHKYGVKKNKKHSKRQKPQKVINTTAISEGLNCVNPKHNIDY